MSDRPQESHIRDLEISLRKDGMARTTLLDGITRKNWVRRDLKRKLDRHVGMEVNGERAIYTCVPDKERK